MKLLLSVCNKLVDPQKDSDKNLLWEFDTDSQQLRPIPLNDSKLPKCLGMTGLTLYREGFVAILQSNPAAAVYLNRDYHIEQTWPLSLVKDGHSVTVNDDRLYVASTGTDAIIEFDPDRGERIYWQANSNGRDSWHINSLAWRQDMLFATAFGPKKGTLWRTAREGFVLDVAHNQRVWEGLAQPHSLLLRDEGMYLCQSASMSLDRCDGQQFGIGGGYTRGLFVSEDRLFVASSVGRKKSRSTGAKIGNPAEGGTAAGECALTVCEWDGRDLATTRVLQETPLKRYASEIYDILAL